MENTLIVENTGFVENTLILENTFTVENTITVENTLYLIDSLSCLSLLTSFKKTHGRVHQSTSHLGTEKSVKNYPPFGCKLAYFSKIKWSTF